MFTTALDFAGACTQLQFQVGEQLELTYNASVLTADAPTISPASNGTHTHVSADVSLKCTGANSTHFIFAMNMFDTMLWYEEDSVIPPGICTIPCGDSDDASKTCCGPVSLGDNVYFHPEYTGDISDLAFSARDSEYLMQIKVGAISALHTNIMSGQAVFTSTETDIVGVHTSHFVTVGRPSSVHVKKKFTQLDVDVFADSSLSK